MADVGERFSLGNAPAYDLDRPGPQRHDSTGVVTFDLFEIFEQCTSITNKLFM